MAQGIVTPLQLTASASMLNNQGINALPSALTTALATINATTLISNFLSAVNSYVTQTYANATTLQSLLTIGTSNCPALGNSIPAAYTNLPYVVTDANGDNQSPYGFTGLIQQTGNAYLGAGDLGKFCQGFMAVQGYLSIVNQFINSAVNVQTYLGPTFTSMDALVTNNISDINPDLGAFATDLYQQGQLWNPANMIAYGTPAGLLQQLAAVGRLKGGFFGGLQTALTVQGLLDTDIQQLIRGQEQLTATEFNTLQMLAYQAMKQVTGDSLAQVLAILDVTLPNIMTMADLLNPIKTFPRSYATLNVPAGATWQPIYQPGTSVNLAIAPLVNAVLPAASGCDELAKVIPPAQAVANKAIQVSLQQATGIPLTTVPALAQTVQGLADSNWNPAITYLANDVVNYAAPDLTVYQAQQDVPAGTDISNTDYWLPTTLGGLSTLSGLPLLQEQTAPVDSSVSTYFATQQATGSGVNGTITTCDVLGTAIDYNNFAAQLNTATTNINSLQTAGALTTLNAAYVNIAGAANNNQVLNYITDANNAIAAIVGNPSYAAQVSALNTAWNAIASALSQERTYQTQASIDYFNLQAGEQVSVMGFVLQLPQYGLQTEECGACDFLEQIANTAILGGQAIVGVMRESRNNQRLSASQLNQNLAPSSEPAVTPIPVINPVY
jgi:hypothetical protein